MEAPRVTVIESVRRGWLDAELAALVWLLIDGGVAVHVVGDDPAGATELAVALGDLATAPGTVTTGPGTAIEEVLRQPVPLRPATGAVLVVAGGRVTAGHLIRPPLRDAGGHVRPQAPAVLAAWDDRDGTWEHFAWAIAPEIGEAIGRPAGDVEIEQGRRRELIDALVRAGITRADEVRAAVLGYAAGPPGRVDRAHGTPRPGGGRAV